MNKVLYLTVSLLALSLVTAADPKCGEGQLLFDSTCVSIAYIPGCALYLSIGQCKTCEYGYILSSAGRCLSNVNQTSDCCNAYNSDGSCAKCSNGLFWSDPYCFRNQIAGCIKKDQNLCLVCGSGYFLKNGTCWLQISGCQNYNANGQCVGCLQGNKLISGFCYPNPAIDNCFYPNEYGSCVQCNEGFYLSPSRACLKYEAGCLKYWQGSCLACHPNFYLNQNKKCIIDACQAYNFDSCAQCLKDYNLQNGKCNLKGCIKVINNTCVQCKQSLRLSANGCVQANTYQCSSCSAGYTFINGSCIKAISGCLQYGNNSLCTSCKAPYQLTINGNCQIVGCQSYFESGCSACVSPFLLNNNICVINNCQKYVNDGCSSCNDGYQLINKQCYSKDANCLQYSPDTKNGLFCTKCADRFFLFQGTCKPALKGCSYDAQGKCTCKVPFNLGVNGTCQILGCGDYNWQTCLSCYSPFSFNSSKQLCQINNCLKYSSTGCTNCANGWAVVNGQCQTGDIYCLSYCTNGICLSCKEGFILDSKSRCVKSIPNCNIFSTDRLTCSQCRSGFSLINGLCYVSIDNCQELSLLNGTTFCKTCKAGYRLSKGLCVANDFNCQSYTFNSDNSTQVCFKCKEGFYFAFNGNCVKQLVGCVYKDNDCVSCITPFSYDSSKKNCYIPGCQIYTNNGCSQCSSAFKFINSTCTIDFCSGYNSNACVSCISGYTLTRCGHCAPTDPNCLKYQGASCSQCKDGFSLTKEGFCVVVDLNCKSYSNGACQSCSSGYYLSTNKKCLIKENGCVYEAGVCKYCNPPFNFDKTKKTCVINACLETDSNGCTKCRSPFSVASDKTCKIKNCLRFDNSGCIQCSPQYHLKNGECFVDNANCLSYNNGLCELCAKGFVLSSNGQCVQTSNSACLSFSSHDKTKCLQCGNDYFLNSFFQCEKKDGNCQEYINGVCSKCKDKFFLYSFICFPYTSGCVQYSGKDCTLCKVNYVLKNGECFLWNKQKLGLLGGDDHYDFDITPIDVRQSKYYINNLSPASEIGKFFFSSYSDASYQDCSLSTLEGNPSKGWKAKVADQNQYIGIQVSESPITFYAIQLQAVQGNYITEFYLQYSVNGTEFITVQNAFKVPSSVASNMTTIYFTGIYASAIRIRISGFKGFPAARINFFYYDLIRFKKIANLKSLTYLLNTINATFVDRVDNQIYINQVYFFNPNAACSVKEMCFTGLQLCQVRQITGLVLNFQDPSNYVTDFYLTYSVDGRSYNCYKNCQVFNVGQLTNGGFALNLDSLSAQGVRIYPTNYKGNANFSPTFFYN